jgi:serine/threonine protein kinase/class 3 adenylate cyclase
MTLDRYRLLAQLGAGDDGAAYRAREVEGDRPVVVCVLSGARADASRWRALGRQLRMAALLDHPEAVAVRALGLDDEPPYVVLDEPPPDDLGAVLAPEVPLGAPMVASLGQSLASAIAAAHRIGLVHGRLNPRTIALTAARTPRIDFTGVAASSPAPETPVEKSCRAPELSGGRTADTAADVYALGAILSWLLRGRPVVPAETRAGGGGLLEGLLGRMLVADPLERPPAGEVLHDLEGLLSSAGVTTDRPVEEAPAGVTRADVSVGPAHPPAPVSGRQLGRFRLLETLGQGGLGQVFRAEDLADGAIVAIKVLHTDVAGRPAALRRFRKEARLLADARSPYVANLIEMNEDGGVHYLAQEFVPGPNLGRLIAERGPLPEALALAVISDVAHALADAHRKGIVHRDVKPENILLTFSRDPPGSADEALPGGSRLNELQAKLADFGLARHVVESESLNVTREGTAVGTVLYMAPEQAVGGEVGPPADVYSLGATLFHALAGRPPFEGDSILMVSRLHAEEAPPSLERLNPAVNPAVARLLEKALAKRPQDRYPDAEAMLRDLDRVRRGEPTDIAVHPQLPACPPERLLQYDWTWDLDAPPERLWPAVCNTDRLNRAVGIPAVEYTTESVAPPDKGLRPGVRRFGRFRVAGITNAWQEHPFEWVEGRRLGVLREYSQGVFKWLASITELTPRAGGGTTLSHRVRIEPRGWMGRVIAAIEVGIKGRRQLERVYRRIDDFASGRLGEGADPFEPPPPVPSAARRRLEGLLHQLVAAGVEADLAWRLGEFLEKAPVQDVARIRPLVLARRLGLDPDATVAACLHGARVGLFVLLWDILCPICRLPSSVEETLRALADHGHCTACNLDFELDFTRAVELIFRAHPQVRDAEPRTWCVGGPFHWPHVAAQVRARPGERVELSLSLPEGTYRLGGPQLPHGYDFRVETTAFLTRWDFGLRPAAAPAEPPCLRAGGQVLSVTNDYDQELLVRVERTAGAADALTAARAASLALFRELFPSEVLSPGQLVSVASVTLLVTDLGPGEAGTLYEALGDARAFGVIHGHYRRVEECVRREGGAVVKTAGEGVVAVFSEPAAAVRAGLDLLGPDSPRPRVGVHSGPAMAATLNGYLDYFGASVALASQLPRTVAAGEMVLTEAVAADPPVADLLRARGLTATVLPGQRGGVLLHRVRPADSSPQPAVSDT